VGYCARIYLCEKNFFLSPRVIPTFNRCSRRCGTFFTEEGGGGSKPRGVIDGGGTLTARLNSHKISFWKRKTASQKINIFFIRRKGEKSRGGERRKFFFREKNTPHTLSSRPTSWILRRFKILFVWWRLTLRGFEPRSLWWKSRTSTRTSSIEKGNDARRPKKKNFFHKDKCGHNKPLYFFWASHSSTKNSCFLVKEWAWTPALKNIV
jgi:hypothetical protein